MSDDAFVRTDEWALIFHHDARFGFFGNKERALFSTNNNIFSVLSRVDETFKIDGKFEFALVYPELEGYSQWTQTINPLQSKPNESNGYENIHFSWSNYQPFDGLGLSSLPDTNLLDGSRDDWTRFYAVGLYVPIVKKNDIIPGPFWDDNLHVVDLYLKIKGRNDLHKLYYICSIIRIRTSISLQILTYIFIFS